MNTYVMAAKINPQSSLAYQGIGNCHLKMGDFARAIDDYERSVSYDHNNKYSYNGLGVAYQNVKNDSRALKNFNRAIELILTSLTLITVLEIFITKIRITVSH